MRDFLNKAFPNDPRMETFWKYLEARKGGITYDGGVGTFNCIQGDPWMVKQIFYFYASMPRELSDVASKVIEKADGKELNTSSEIIALSRAARRVGTTLDEYTRTIAGLAPWRKIYNGPVPVMRVWRTRSDEVVGEPEDRNLSLDMVPNRYCSFVIAENEQLGTKKVMMALSDGKYVTNPGSADVRQDFLLDMSEMFDVAINPKIGRRKTVSVGEGQKILSEIVDLSEPVISATLDLADCLHKMGALQDEDGIFMKMVEKKTELKPEDNPNALYEIGGWA